MGTSLLRIFAPLDTEGGLGFYRRLSEANGLSGWKELARLSEVSSARSGLFNFPEHVATMLGVESAACQMASAREEIALGWRGLRRAGYDAICPDCLKESMHIRLGWDHAYVVACPTHKTMLIDKCGECGQRLSDQREQIGACSCGHHLLASETRPATEAQLWVASVIASRGAHSGSWLPAVDDVQLDLFSLLVRNLCQLFDPLLTVIRENAAAPKTIQESVEFLRPLENLLHHWPRGFEAHVRDRIAAGPENSRTLNTRLGKWYLRIRELGLETARNPFTEVIHQLAANEYADVLALDHVAGNQGRIASHFTLPEAAAHIGIHRATLLKAVAAGEVACVTRPYANRGVSREISVADAQAIATARKAWTSEEHARELLNVPESVFKNFLKAGLVVIDNSGRTDIRRGASIELAALERLQARLMLGALRSSDECGARLLLRELHARRLGDKQSIVRLLRAISNGDVLPLKRAPSVGELEYLESDVATFFASKSVDAGLTVQALATATGWKWESISHWIDQGLLESVHAVLRGQPCRVILPEHLIRFSQTFVPLASLAHSLNARSSQVLDRLGDIEMVGAKALPSGARRGGLVRLADLAAAALRPAV